MYLLLVTLHVLAAMVWVGGVLFLALVGAPALRRVEPPVLRTALFDAIGTRFRVVGWGAVAILLLSGTWLAWYRGWLAWGVLARPTFWSTSVGMAFGWKLVLVAVMLATSLAHDVALSPARAQAMQRHPDGARIRRLLVLLARVGAVAALGVVAAAVRLVRA